MNKSFLAGRILIEAIAPIFGGLIVVWLLWNVETRYLPVVKDFKVTHAVYDSKGYTAIGTVNRLRSCEVINIAVIKVRDGKPTVLVESYPRDIFSADASLGENAWGPITLPVNRVQLEDDDVIKVVGLHRCHALWLKQTEYMSENWESLKALAAGSPNKPATERNNTRYFIRVAPIALSQ